MSDTSPKALITGASGFIGGHTACAFLQRGYHVVAQYRRAEPPRHLRDIERRGGTLLRLDFAFPGAGGGALAEHLADVDVVAHTAAYVSDYGRREEFRRANVDATDRLLAAARAAGVKRFVFVSSISVHGFGPHVDTAEEGPYYPYVSDYQRSKKEAEERVLAMDGPGFRCVVIRPGLVYGPGDTTTMRPVLELLIKGSFPLLGGLSSLNCPVYVTDLVSAVVAAAERGGIGGEVFNVTGGERVTLREMADVAAEILGVPKPSKVVPVGPAYALAAVLEWTHRLLGIRNAPLLTRYRVSQLSNDFHFSIEKARRILGYRPAVGWREGIRKAIDLYRSDGTEFGCP